MNKEKLSRKIKGLEQEVKKFDSEVSKFQVQTRNIQGELSELKKSRIEVITQIETKQTDLQESFNFVTIANSNKMLALGKLEQIQEFYNEIID
jgi:chromosome segregation ATPase